MHAVHTKDKREAELHTGVCRAKTGLTAKTKLLLLLYDLISTGLATGTTVAKAELGYSVTD